MSVIVGIFQGMAELIPLALRVGGFLAIVGTAARVLLPSSLGLPPGLGTTTGLGLSVALPVISLNYALATQVHPQLWALLVASSLVLVSAAAKGAWDRRRGRHLEGFRFRQVVIPDRTDLVAAVLALAALLPVVRFGATSWTSGPNDIPNYVASAQTWLSNSGVGPDFGVRHPDNFGQFQIARAGFEKPFVTSFMLLAEWSSGVETWRLPTVILFLALVLTAQSLLRTLTSAFDMTLVTATLCVIPPFFSIVAMSRVHAAQLGHSVAVALVSFAVLLVTASRLGARLGSTLGVGGLAGLSIASSLGANFTLVVASLPMILALMWLLMGQAGVSASQQLRAGAMGGLVVVLVALPFFSWFRFSLALQSAGRLGLAIPSTSPMADVGLEGSSYALPSPFALLGLQPGNPWGGPFTYISVAAWVLVLYLLVVRWIGVAEVRSARTRPVMVFSGVSFLNVGAIAISSGINSYGVFKWMSVFIVLSVPFLLGFWVVRLAQDDGRRARLLALAVAASSVAISTLHGWVIGEPGRGGYVATDDLLGLAGDSRLAGLDLNLQLGGPKPDSMAAVVVTPSSSTVVSRTYARGTAPTSEWFLIESADAYDPGNESVVLLNDTYALARRSFDTGLGSVDFSVESAFTRRLLYGDWYWLTDSGGAVSGTHSSVRLTLPSLPVGQDLMIDLVGIPRPASERALTTVIRANGRIAASMELGPGKSIGIPLRIPASWIGSDRYLTLEFLTDVHYFKEMLRAYRKGEPLGFVLQGIHLSTGRA